MVRVRTLKKEIEQLHSMAEDNQFVIGLLAEAVEARGRTRSSEYQLEDVLVCKRNGPMIELRAR